MKLFFLFTSPLSFVVMRNFEKCAVPITDMITLELLINTGNDKLFCMCMTLQQ